MVTITFTPTTSRKHDSCHRQTAKALRPVSTEDIYRLARTLFLPLSKELEAANNDLEAAQLVLVRETSIVYTIPILPH